MIKEYAVEPELLNRWHIVSHLTDQCNVYNGRRISIYPSNWFGKVRDTIQNNADCKPRERHKIFEKLNYIKRNKNFVNFKLFADDYEEYRSWISNACRIKNLNDNSFHAIVSNKSSNEGFVIPYEECDNEIGHELWKSDYTKIIKRSENDILESIKWLLNSSNEIYLIDKHFQYEKRYIRSLKAILGYIEENKRHIKISKFQIHLSMNGDIKTFAHNLSQEIFSCLPDNFEIELVNRKIDELHQRLIMSEYCAIEFEHGLDIYIDGSYIKETNVTILSQNVFKQLKDEHFNKGIDQIISS
jgi:hypothetical protein